MIGSFKGKFAEQVSRGSCPKGFAPDLLRPAQRKLAALMSATELADLRVPPGNRLEALSGIRAGQHSIRINQQWRICFRWVDGRAEDVEIVDYH
ncbi:type II toxin-antitoxin system RelE/ParE family toxin [Devosia sp.]|uniref:type II toxin-antitoxin system RelE/ParE family toxin n=1 Tax=Devosia sp. TaxID=1871048 RepID=UPI0027373902|nr:type II toxin-antitoxin system RelE/ParE family toxin [Devosia sp.]MDP2782635.1 type II toxin-antitoxin system RelE/ParE family toxin [Devosia sp.]